MARSSSNIKPLSKSLIKKIAAGQVVERPASVVKEFVENSLDAGALTVKVEIKKGGLDLIKVTDDGEGMSERDVKECFKSHTTSKIFLVDDLLSVMTLGFRGEALASICAVGTVTIRSRALGEINGRIVRLEGGEVVQEGSVGMPEGTSVSVEKLFQDVPARKKFLKTTKTEFRNIVDVLVNFALAHPGVSFFLSHNKRIILDLPGEQTVAERIDALLGSKIGKYLIPVSFEETHFKISGFVTKPQIASASRSKQHLFVNRRPITSSLISDAVREAYGTLLPSRDHPVFVLFFELPATLTDVNVHPRKEKVAFTDDSFIFKLFKSAVGEVFEREDLTYEAHTEHDDSDIFSYLLGEGNGEYLAQKTDFPILQIHNLYLVQQTGRGVLLIDQHAAHERILYERLLRDFKQGYFDEVKELANPITFTLSVSDSEALLEHGEEFKRLGFDIDEFGKNTFKLTLVPSIVNDKNAQEIIEEILTDLKSGKGIKTLNTTAKGILSSMACKSAIKSGDYLSMEQRKDLLEELEKTKTKYTCPHGRPVKIELTLKELARLFKRG